ncbi:MULTISPECIES: putative colanic acid biosynthesis acetyltransferase [unclassified Leeuwenhoekiella]|uniref:putative colanic acid biosynthesis acetyltransferase n=1 Tax=unclassified Leeuwenhoekiella TaxID=2615029 RepID=UPI000C507CA8|nr:MULTISPECIES: putative colanic acid biosynthesis acetyltransferase [unclassified Leeuwenhoekiella]MAW97089.1 putative colanic acid biosynthesis acetyltransferase [Leeuwenhoekiella sp.]MBA82605.1 putative colanic acid biosynthesis acetyltransferase [Leeuwenhoekiella sp.]|tara:strand:- start:10536 stop:11090 length:555 start_codon:yes stop_codon:yes gene_type:complete
MENNQADLSQYRSDFGLKNKLARVLWNSTYLLLFRPFGTRFFKKYRVFILKCFGAKLEYTSHIYASVRIWAPWNLTMGSYSTLGPAVDCYNQGNIYIGDQTTISQKSYLCASTHDFTKIDFPLTCKPIQIGNSVWIAADSFVGPGVIIGDGAVAGARSAIFKNVDPWTVVGGNPARIIKQRILE